MGSDTLIIVESNGKTKKIEKFTGHKCVASFGHIFALKPTLKWFDPNTVEPEYITIKGKENIVSQLKAKAKAAKNVIIASDLDREGEAIAAHLMKLLNLNVATTKRITFNQISEKALKEALANPGLLDQNLYHAQQARAVIDIVFGFLVSPFLSKHMNVRALSAGRCQSPAIRMIYTRQIEQKVGNIGIQVSAKSNQFPKIIHVNPILRDKEQVKTWLDYLITEPFKVTKVGVQEKKETPPPPFITSSLQQHVYNRFGMNPKNTMQIAQSLYEGGYITYMRTDCVALSSQFQTEAVKWVTQKYGNTYASKRSYSKKGKQKTQDAHEAIRPISITKEPPSDTNQAKVYEAIRVRAIASQMAQAIISESKLTMETTRKNDTILDTWESIERNVVFPGYRIITSSETSLYESENSDVTKPVSINSNTQIGDIINITEIRAFEHANLPPPPYNPASFVKMLEKTGIGRPSTYSSIIERIQEKGYVQIGTNPKLDIELNQWLLDFNKKQPKVKESKYIQKVGGQKKVFCMTDLGYKACQFMESSPIESIVNAAFTGDLENKLDLVAAGTIDWKDLVREFHLELTKKLALQPPPNKEFDIGGNKSHQRNWVRILSEENGITLGVINSTFGYSIVKEDNTGKLLYAQMPPESTPEDLTLEEANSMYQYPKCIKDGVELKIGKFGWYVTNGTRSVSLGSERIPPTKDVILESLHKKPSSEILKTISAQWSLRKRNESCYLMYTKSTGKSKQTPTFIPVSDPSGKWTVARCEEMRKKYKK